MFRHSVRALALAMPWAIATTFLSGVITPGIATAPDKRSQAIALYNNKDYRGAAALLDDYLTVNNRDPYAAYYAALANQQTGNSNKARIYYRLVYALAPNTQIGGYARNILLKLDPSFAATVKPPATGSTASTQSDTVSTSSAAVSPAPEAETALDPNMPKECRVRFEKGQSHIQLDCYIDGRALKMYFDTGAPTVCVGMNQLSEIGAPIPTGPANGYTGGAANGKAIKFWDIKSTVKVGPMERKNCLVRVLENNSAEPLLGQTFFQGFDYTIDQGGGEIVFRQKALTAKLGRINNSVSVPFEFREAGNRIVVQVEVNGKSGPMMFDTGCSSSACVFKSFGEAYNFGLQIPEDSVRHRHMGVSGGGSALHFNVKRIKLGPIDRSDVEVAVNEGVPTGREALPLLGQPFWQGYEYTIDMDKKLIHFVRR